MLEQPTIYHIRVKNASSWTEQKLRSILKYFLCIKCHLSVLTFSLSVLDSNVVDRGLFEHLSGSNKDYEIGICCKIKEFEQRLKFYDRISINKTTSTTSSFKVRSTRNHLYFSLHICILLFNTKLSSSYIMARTRYFPYKYAGYTVCATWLRLFLHEPNKNCDQSLNDLSCVEIPSLFNSLLRPLFFFRTGNTIRNVLF
jgi:hypothetical protein